MKKLFIILFSLFTATQLCLAQMDTLIGKWGEAIPVKVQSFTKNGLRVERQMQTVDDKVMHVKYSDLEAIRFADGFELRFRDGALVRDNLLSAPSFRRSFIDVKAEGKVTLAQAELRQYYGSRNYDVIYKPYRDQFFTGLGKLGGGALGFALSTGLCKAGTSTWSDSFWYSRGDEQVLQRTYYEEGNRNPFWSTAAFFFLGTMVDGLVDCTVSKLGHGKLFNHPDEATVPSAAASKGLLWGGVALSAAGIGALTASCVDLNTHRHWYFKKTVPEGIDPNTVVYIKEGERPSSWVKYALVGGALAANLGFSAVQLGAARMSALHRLDGSSYALQVIIGPSPSGCGFMMRF